MKIAAVILALWSSLTAYETYAACEETQKALERNEEKRDATDRALDLAQLSHAKAKARLDECQRTAARLKQNPLDCEDEKDIVQAEAQFVNREHERAKRRQRDFVSASNALEKCRKDPNK